MATVHLYVPDDLYSRRGELPPEETLSGIFHEAFRARLDRGKTCEHGSIRCASCGHEMPKAGAA